jgi:hypothetical protein
MATRKIFSDKNVSKMTDIELLKEAKEALINRDAVKCYNSGDKICQCTLCNIDNYLKERIELPEINTFHSNCIPCELRKYYVRIKNLPF